MADAVGSVLSLLGLIVQKLEDVDVCKRKAARMRGYLEGVRPLIQDLQQSQQDTTRIESVLQEILPLVEAGQRRSRSRVARIMAWMNAYKVRSMLEEAEKHLLMELTILRVGTPTPTEVEAQHAHENAQDANDDVRQLRSDMDEAEAGGELDPAAHRRMVAVMDEVDPEDLGDRLAQTEHACAEQRAAEFLARSIAPRLEADVANIDEQALRVDEHTVLGRGAFGEVLAGILYGSERVAVKRVPEQANQLQTYEQQALQREAQQWRSLSHPNIVKLIGTCVQRSRLLLVMERCDLSLDMLLHERVDVELSVEQQATIIKGVARGMAYLHSCNMIHRDIKPANVLLSHALGKVKLTDFGLVTIKAAHTSRAATTSPQGSPAYMAPEVLLPPAVWTTRADVYAFGIVAWEVIHRHRPWADTLSPEDLNDRVRGQGKRPAFSPRVDVQLWLVDLIKECWAQEVNARPQSADLLQRFEANTPRRRSTRILKAVFGALKRRSAVRQQPQQPEPQRKQEQRASQHDRDLRVAQSLQKQEELVLALEQQAQALERDRQVAEDIQRQLAEEELPGSAAQASRGQGSESSAVLLSRPGSLYDNRDPGRLDFEMDVLKVYVNVVRSEDSDAIDPVVTPAGGHYLVNVTVIRNHTLLRPQMPPGVWICLVLDNSGSMHDRDVTSSRTNEPCSRVERGLEYVEDVLKLCAERNRDFNREGGRGTELFPIYLSVIAFASDAEEVLPVTLVLPETVAANLAKVNQMTAGGGANMEAALELYNEKFVAFQEHQERRNAAQQELAAEGTSAESAVKHRVQTAHLVLVTDGDVNDPVGSLATYGRVKEMTTDDPDGVMALKAFACRLFGDRLAASNDDFLGGMVEDYDAELIAERGLDALLGAQRLDLAESYPCPSKMVMEVQGERGDSIGLDGDGNGPEKHSIELRIAEEMEVHRGYYRVVVGKDAPADGRYCLLTVKLTMGREATANRPNMWSDMHLWLPCSASPPAADSTPISLEEWLLREVVKRLRSIHASVLLPEEAALAQVLEELDDDVRTTMNQRGGFPELALFQRIVELQQEGYEAGLAVYRDEGVRAAVLSASANYVPQPRRALTGLERLQKRVSVQRSAQPDNPVAVAAVRRLSAAYGAVLTEAMKRTAELSVWLSTAYGDRIPRGDIMAAHALCIDLKTKLRLYKESHKLRSLVIQAGLEPHRGANDDRPPHKVMRDEFKAYRELPGRIPAYKLANDEVFAAFAAEDYFAKVIRCIERRRVLQEVSWNLADRTYRRWIKRKSPRPTQDEYEVYVSAGWAWLARAGVDL